MDIHLIAVGHRMPNWVKQGVDNYVRRLPQSIKFHLVQIPTTSRARNPDTNTILKQEGSRILAAVPKQHIVIALEVEGDYWSTPKFASKLENWRDASTNLAFIIGGPDGLSDECLARSDQRWSVSPLTLPHPLVRILVVEQIYRAWTIIARHPYHCGH